MFAREIEVQTSVTGGGSYGSAIRLRRGDVSVKNSCINQDGEGRNGIYFDGSETGYSVSDTSITVPDASLLRNGAPVSTSNITSGDACPLPSGVTYDQFELADIGFADVPIPSSASRMAQASPA